MAAFLAPVVTPVLVKLLGGVLFEIEFWPMFQTMLMTVLIPLLLGMGLHRLLGTGLSVARELAPAVAAIVIICSYAVAANQVRIADLGPQVLLGVIGVKALGYLAGWWLARLSRFDFRHGLALAIEIGMQNAGQGAALALKHFQPETALPRTLFAA